MTTNTNTTACSCGETSPHVVAKRVTADGIGVEIWHDGAVTGRIGQALHGVPIARPRTAESLAVSLAAGWLLAGEVEIYNIDEVPRPRDPVDRLDVGVTDADRIAAATVRGTRMIGPDERQRCARHPKRWQIYRWTWPVGDSPENGTPEIVRGCGACAEAE